MTKIRRYSELLRLETHLDRFRYLALRGVVGQPTFGSDRWVNQKFYGSTEWRHIRHEVIARDNGCDLGVDGFDVHDRIYIHHMNPMTVGSIRDHEDEILDPEYLVAVSFVTHNAIHYGDEKLLPKIWVARSAGDTKLW